MVKKGFPSELFYLKIYKFWKITLLIYYKKFFFGIEKIMENKVDNRIISLIFGGFPFGSLGKFK